MNMFNKYATSLRTKADSAEKIGSNIDSWKNRSRNIERIATSPVNLADDPVYSQVKELMQYFQNLENKRGYLEKDPFPILTIIRLQMETRSMREGAYLALYDSTVEENAKKILKNDFLELLGVRGS